MSIIYIYIYIEMRLNGSFVMNLHLPLVKLLLLTLKHLGIHLKDTLA